MSKLRLLLASVLLAWNAAQAAQEWRVLALRVDFPAETPDEASTSGQGGFDLRPQAEALPQYLAPFDTPPHDRAYFERQLQALSRYYRVVSEGQVQIDFGVFPAEDQRAYTLSRPALYYGIGRTREQIGRRSVGEVLDLFFAGSARSLVSQLLDSEKLSREELAQIRREIDRRLRGQS